MSEINLHEGTFLRQVLKGRRLVRLTFIPDRSNSRPQSTRIKIEDDSKPDWEKCLGNQPGVDIDLGTLVIRFNSEGKSGTAFFLPNMPSQNDDAPPHRFEQIENADTFPGGEGEGGGEFFACINNKQTLLGANFSYPQAVIECWSRLFT